MPAGVYNIHSEQGATFRLFMTFYDENNQPVDLEGAESVLVVKKSKTDPEVVLLFDSRGGTNGVYGSTAGEWHPETGITFAGTGGIYLNKNENMEGHTGGIYITSDRMTMTYAPTGQHFYELRIEYPNATVERILQGRFIHDPGVLV